LSFPTHRAVGTAALFGLFIAAPGVIDGLPPGSVGYVNLPAAAAIALATSQNYLSLTFALFKIFDTFIFQIFRSDRMK